MSSERDRFRVELDVDAGGEARSLANARVKSSAFGPFRIALIGDFSGRLNRRLLETGKSIADRRPVRVDRDNLDDVIARIAPRLELQFRDRHHAVEIAFTSMDDFHPDSLYERLHSFRELRDAGARAIASAAALHAERTRSTPAVPGNLLDAILGDAPMPPGGQALAKPTSRPSLDTHNDGGLSDFVKQALTPHLVPGTDPTEAQIQSQIDAAANAELRALLHHSDFQQLESAWRGVEFLLRRLDTDGGLQLHLIDISPEELAADLGKGAVHESGFYRLVVEATVGTPGAPAWAILAGLFPLGRNAGDVVLLHRLGLVGSYAGAPFVAGAAPEVLGIPSIASRPDPEDWSDSPLGWTQLRQSSAAPHLALALPRLLLREPYGKNGVPCDHVAFEEMDANQAPEHEHFLWGSGALAVALLLGEAFTESGWALRPGRDIGGLPLHVHRVEGETVAVPCAEALLTERASDALLDRGLTPLLGLRDSDTLIVPRVQSLAEPLRSLAGRWTLV